MSGDVIDDVSDAIIEVEAIPPNRMMGALLSLYFYQQSSSVLR